MLRNQVHVEGLAGGSGDAEADQQPGGRETFTLRTKVTQL